MAEIKQREEEVASHMFTKISSIVDRPLICYLGCIVRTTASLADSAADGIGKCSKWDMMTLKLAAMYNGWHRRRKERN